jgi:putative membrane protein
MMRRLLGLVLPLVGSATAVWLSTWVFDREFFDHAIGLDEGMTTGATVRTVLIVAVIFGLVNLLVKPIVRFVTFPIRILTFGLFSLVINGAMLLVTGVIAYWLDLPFHVAATFWVILVAVFIGIVSGVLSWLGDKITSIEPHKTQRSGPPPQRDPRQQSWDQQRYSGR